MSMVVDFPVKPEARPYLSAFAEGAGEPYWVCEWRRRNLARFAEAGFPGRGGENWRYLDLRTLEANPLTPTDTGGPHLTRDGLPEGVWFGPLAEAMLERPEFARALATDGDAVSGIVALNAAFCHEGFILDAPGGVVIEQPIEIVHPAQDAIGSHHTRSLVNLGKGSRATIVETYVGESRRYWRNDVVTVQLAERAELTRIVLVEEGTEAIHTALTDVQVGAGARFNEFVLMLGGSRVRHETNICLAGEGASCSINGAYIVASDHEANIVTAIDHAAPGGRTSELIKGVAADRGHGAFQGRIVVRPHAQKTDARQTSRNLMLGRRAVIDTKPELEIEADDVKCAHGASVGDLDETALFYLRTRGIPNREARQMLIEGFLREATDSVGDAAIRERLQRRLAARLATLEEAE